MMEYWEYIIENAIEDDLTRNLEYGEILGDS
jgi:hypothetical protein